MIQPLQLWHKVLAVRNNAPLVHNITNYVVMNNTANALLAVGASPVMAHAHEEMEDMVNIAGALVVNIGTLDSYWVTSMLKAIGQAQQLQKPWVLDPVGAGASQYRNQVLHQLLQAGSPAVIRGNASEILSLANTVSATKGVDSTHSSEQALQAAQAVSASFNTVVCVSGETDFIVYNNTITGVSNGHALMTRVTGLGCTASAITGAFCAVADGHYKDAAIAAMAVMGVAGEIAAAKSDGPGSLQMHFIDALYNLSEEAFVNHVKLSTHESF
ncbi:hydroxyethylthiazole kinase [Filimonas lacunae]|uniref:Hydroxyethylthiazole kinase n=1 Tax=Filimonas lacunae TaxID=477680 RepID=A0A173MC75_9BACT|nr:hydroxyethylthiazole kinase [Filimonas lacunae]BAV05137.1 hydroxyethylthiazole kinase [Filimonas lacunae]SIT34170.1 hydroxyethylthiazole kinase [Filimonas lacunae]